ncbi:hypothetical protein HHI36_000371 [Cryptolaemus montrouzieri]|uniref:Uncharacterized protein n=1 Tax=Cryptolaemus montrouzieri TaxID=559131 RepID=A0ABD2P557_9CUCU
MAQLTSILSLLFALVAMFFFEGTEARMKVVGAGYVNRQPGPPVLNRLNNGHTASVTGSVSTGVKGSSSNFSSNGSVSNIHGSSASSTSNAASQFGPALSKARNNKGKTPHAPIKKVE